MTPEFIASIRNLTGDEIQARLEELADEERTLRVLLRSVRARERAKREKEKEGE